MTRRDILGFKIPTGGKHHLEITFEKCTLLRLRDLNHHYDSKYVVMV